VEQPHRHTLPTESVGIALLRDSILDIGGVAVARPVAWPGIGVYIRRSARDRSLVEDPETRHPKGVPRTRQLVAVQ
jgi:hypothetical protein